MLAPEPVLEPLIRLSNLTRVSDTNRKMKG